MRPVRLATTLGAVATASVLALLALPYGYARPSAVGTYYGVGGPGVLFVGLLVVVATIALVAGARERSDPATAAGIALTVSVVAVGLAIAWALPAREVIAGMAVPDYFEYHPFVVGAATALLAVAAGLFASATIRSAPGR